MTVSAAALALVSMLVIGLLSVCKQMKLLGECSGTIDSVKRLEHKLKEEEESLPGFVNLNSTETQTAGECVLLSARKSEAGDLGVFTHP